MRYSLAIGLACIAALFIILLGVVAQQSDQTLQGDQRLIFHRGCLYGGGVCQSPTPNPICNGSPQPPGEKSMFIRKCTAPSVKR